MSKHFKCFFFVIIIILKMAWPFNIVFPCSVEAFQLGSSEVWFKSDFGLFEVNRNNAFMNFTHEKKPLVITIGSRHGLSDGIFIINESGSKFSSSLVKFITKCQFACIGVIDLCQSYADHIGTKPTGNDTCDSSYIRSDSGSSAAWHIFPSILSWIWEAFDIPLGMMTYFAICWYILFPLMEKYYGISY